MLKFVTHSKGALRIAVACGWRPGARYTNLRDIRGLPFEGTGFLDIDWKNYDFERHLEITASTKPHATVARDLDSISLLETVLKQAEQLARYADSVIIVPKDPLMADGLDTLIPREYILGYSVPSRYGGTPIPPECFHRPVHLLGGRPDVQRGLAEQMQVVSIDCNRFTLDARFGDFFDGRCFRPHPIGGYERCLLDSITSINTLWEGYLPAAAFQQPERRQDHGRAKRHEWR